MQNDIKELFSSAKKIEGLMEFIICTAYIALRKRTHTLWSKSISMELNFQRRRGDQSFDGGNCISNQSFSNHPLHAIPLCNQKKFISNASSQGSIIEWHLPKSSSSKGNPLSEIGFYSSFEGMKRKWDVHCTNGQLSKISPGWWECCPSLESDSFHFDSYKIAGWNKILLPLGQGISI